jgi:hypothetical protein
MHLDAFKASLTSYHRDHGIVLSLMLAYLL